MHGDVLHDCHAEVLVRRSVRTWILERLVCEGVSTDDNPAGLPRILEPVHGGANSARRQLREDVHLHLYISTLPCGGASTEVLQERNRKQDMDAGRAPWPHALSSCPVLRGREGGTSHAQIPLRTKPGRADAPPSISMSCTDKLRLWNEVGLHGALLSHWIDPFFFSTLVLSTPAHTSDTQALATACHAAVVISPDQARPSIAFVPVSFEHSRDNVDARMASLTGIAPDDPAWGDVEPVPSSAGASPDLPAIAWRRGHRMENILGGIKMGASSKRRGANPLPLSSQYVAVLTRSSLCQRAWFRYVVKARAQLEDFHPTLYANLTYQQAKTGVLPGAQPHVDACVQAYQQAKRRLCGEDTPQREARVRRFVDKHTSSANPSDTPAEMHGGTAPLAAWLITPRGLRTFCLDVEA